MESLPVSVVIPCFDSSLAQTHPVFRVTVMNGGATPGSTPRRPTGPGRAAILKQHAAHPEATFIADNLPLRKVRWALVAEAWPLGRLRRALLPRRRAARRHRWPRLGGDTLRLASVERWRRRLYLMSPVCEHGHAVVTLLPRLRHQDRRSA